MISKKILSIILAGVLLVSFGVWFYFEKKNKQTNQAEEIVTYGTTEFVTYTNAKGKSWFLPKAGKHSFYVASENKYPKFIKGVIDPLKVSIGDIQKMEIVVENPEPLKNVWAEIEHDKGKDVVNLELVSENIVSQNDLNLPFVVDENNQLLPVTLSNKNKVEKIINSLVEKAKAQGAVQYTYRGQWKVHSTQTITYHTTFIAEDKNGNIDKLVLAWSDPCYFYGNKIGSDCALTASVDGLETNIGFSGAYTVTVNSGGVFVWNPGKTITLENGGKFSFAGGELKQAYLYYDDADGDSYAPNDNKSWNSSPGPIAGKVRVSSALGTNDCYEATPTSTTRAHLVHPGQTNYFYTTSTYSVQGGWDYNCSGFVEGGWSENSADGTNVISKLFVATEEYFETGYHCSTYNAIGYFSPNYPDESDCGKSYSSEGGCFTSFGFNDNNDKDLFKFKKIADFFIKFFVKSVKAIPTYYYGYYFGDDNLRCNNQNCVPTVYGKCH